MAISIDKNVLCGALWMHQDIETNGDIQDCCASLTDRNEFNITTHSLKDEWNSDRKRDMRMQMLRGEQPKSCRWCYDTEKLGVESVRSHFNSGFFNKISNKELQETWDNNGAVTRPAEAIQIQTGNLCNLACKMCRPALSTSVGKFYKKHFDDPAKVTFIKRLPTLIKNDSFDLKYDWPVTSKLSTLLADVLSDFKMLYITGGEPTIIKENIEFLQYLVDNGYSKNIDIRTNTNCTNINQDLLDLMSQFKSACISASIDGMDEIAYIQRHPSDWRTVNANLDKIGAWAQTQPHHTINITSVVTNLNAHHILDTLAYLCNKYQGFGVNVADPHLINLCWQSPESSLGIEHIPKQAIDQIVATVPDYYGKIPYAILNQFKNGLTLANTGLTYRYIHQALDTVQAMHPELNIKDIYKIYYQHLP
jgi:MoaA/NifB/PqqE/SkfB family radical SAM enzyme